jgi:O-antigen ligase
LRALAMTIAAATIVVPCVFTTMQADAFAGPKLITLWALLSACLVLAAAAVFTSGTRTLVLTGGHAVDAALAALLLLNLGAYVTSVDQHQSLTGEHLQYQGLLTVFLYTGLFLVARMAFGDAALVARLLACTVVGGTIVAAYGVIQQTHLDPVWGASIPGGRVFSSIGQTDALAAYLVITIACGVAFVAYRWLIRLMALLATGLMVTCLILTQSRGGFAGATVALVVAAAGMAWRTHVNPRRLIAGVALTIVGAAVLYAVVTPVRSTIDHSWDRALSSTNTAGDISVAYHLDFWHEAIRIAADHPLLGTGQDTFPIVFPRYTSDLPYLRGIAVSKYRVESAHNVYLNMAATTGLPATAAYLAVVVLVVVALGRGASATRDRRIQVALVGIVAAIIGHLVTDVFVSAELTSTSLLWILMGAGYAIASAQRATQATDHDEPVPQAAIRTA